GLYKKVTENSVYKCLAALHREASRLISYTIGMVGSLIAFLWSAAEHLLFSSLFFNRVKQFIYMVHLLYGILIK
ncbi:MAG: hypothetical protein J7L69_09840, partial [Desulfobulbaceae bacterium]|nr:hypothetical protein [Desulfobulbaceae bacterium]